MSEPAQPTPDAIVEELRAALAAAPEAALAPYALSAVEVRQFVAPAAVIEWRTPENTSLGFIIAPTDPAARTFARTKRFDVIYFSSDFVDAEQDRAYQRDHGMINHFARWMKKWDPAS